VVRPQKRANADEEAGRLGVPRQSLIEVLVARALEKQGN